MSFSEMNERQIRLNIIGQMYRWKFIYLFRQIKNLFITQFQTASKTRLKTTTSAKNSSTKRIDYRNTSKPGQFSKWDVETAK